MITELDEINDKYWHWQPVHFIYDGLTVYIRLEELFINNVSEDIKIGDAIIKDLHKIESNENSKRYDLIFNDVHFFQAYDELKHLDKENEQFDKGIIRRYTKSNLLDYIENNTSFREASPHVFLNWKHFCVMTSTDWFDILVLSDPIIKKFKKENE